MRTREAIDDQLADDTAPAPQPASHQEAAGAVWSAALSAVNDQGLTGQEYVAAVAAWMSDGDPWGADLSVAPGDFAAAAQANAALRAAADHAASELRSLVDDARTHGVSLAPADIIYLWTNEFADLLAAGWDPRLLLRANELLAPGADTVGVDAVAILGTLEPMRAPADAAERKKLQERKERAQERASHANSLLEAARTDGGGEGPDAWFAGDDSYAQLRARAAADRERIRATGGVFPGTRRRVYGTTDDWVNAAQNYGIRPPAWYQENGVETVQKLRDHAKGNDLPLDYWTKGVSFTGSIAQLRKVQLTRWHELRHQRTNARGEAALATAAGRLPGRSVHVGRPHPNRDKSLPRSR